MNLIYLPLWKQKKNTYIPVKESFNGPLKFWMEMTTGHGQIQVWRVTTPLQDDMDTDNDFNAIKKNGKDKFISSSPLITC